MHQGTENNGKNGKLVDLDDLVDILASLREQKKTIVHCHGCFDLLHIGHIRYLDQARQFGDVLVVTITSDRYVDKGPHRPAFTASLRAEALASLDCVDYVAVNRWPTAEETLRLLRPHIYVKGSDFDSVESDSTGKLAREEAVVKEIGASLRFTRDLVFSSTNLINRFLSSFPDNVQQYLKVFRARNTLVEVLACVEEMARLKVLVVGDTIIDDYRYCRPIGTSNKDPVLALQYESHDLFAGGVLAVANHVANFAREVRLFTVLGEKDSHESFIREKLLANIQPVFAVQKNAPTIVKRRFVEGYSLSKLLELYIMDDAGLDEDSDQSLCREVGKALADVDLVIVADFGHGAISENMRGLLETKAPYLAVNTQANAGNRGFHTISKYNRADFASIAEHELRLEMRDTTGRVKPMMDVVAKKIRCPLFVVTRGRKGCVVRAEDGMLVEVPAFAQKVVDRIGAGDAVLSVTALAACLGASPELIGLLGNVVGALAVEILGNQKCIDKLSVNKYMTSLLK